MNSYRIIRQPGTVLTANANSGPLDNSDAAWAVFFINISAVSGTTPTLTLTITGVDYASGAAYNILATTALNGAGSTILRVGKGFLAAANATVNDVLPRQYLLQYVLGGTATPTVTFSVGVQLGS